MTRKIKQDNEHLISDQRRHAHYWAFDEGLTSAYYLAGSSLAEISRYHATLHQLFEQVLADIPCPRQQTSQPWDWHPLLDSDDVRAGVLTVYPGHAIPLHDHPGSTGLLIVLEADVTIRQYDLSTPAKHKPLHRPVELTMLHEYRFSPAGYTVFGPCSGNIHTLEAGDKPCTLFDVLLAPYRDHERSWYMPLQDSSDDPACVHAIRLKNPFELDKG